MNDIFFIREIYGPHKKFLFSRGRNKMNVGIISKYAGTNDPDVYSFSYCINSK